MASIGAPATLYYARNDPGRDIRLRPIAPVIGAERYCIYLTLQEVSCRNRPVRVWCDGPFLI